MEKKLSIIIPYGLSHERPFIDERVLGKIKELSFIDEVELIFVEGYSSKENPLLQEAIIQNGHRYYKDEKQTAFNLGECRNIGVINSYAQVFIFLDVDYYISRETLKKLLQLIEVKQIAEHPNNFLVMPCVFLTEFGTGYIQSQSESKWDILIQYDIISESKNIAKSLAIGSSSIVMNKHKYMEMGGNDPSFCGHGYEDFDFMYRLIVSTKAITEFPQSLSYDARSWNFTTYKGFRALFSVPGFEAIPYGLYLYHFDHPRPNNDGYLDNMKTNHNRFYSRLNQYHIMPDGPDPILYSQGLGKKALIFTAENGSPYRSLRGLVPYLGELVCKRERDFFDYGSFSSVKLVEYIRSSNIDYIIFPNPYGNELRKEIYDYVRENQIPYFCYDRGALPDSWFMDKNGFNYDSISYDESLWNVQLTTEEVDEVEKYIYDIKNSNNFLEAQGEKLDSDSLRRGLGIRHKKVAFIPLQVETDTVIKYFTREPFDYYGFLNIANNAAKKLQNRDWVFVAKKHPLMKEIDKEKYSNIIFTDNNANISSLLELADIIFTINSGVGVYAMMHEKPCILAGNAFYHFDGINTNIHSENELVEYVSKGDFSFDKDKMHRFIYYLYKKFYLYGNSYYKTGENEERTFRIVNYIDFYQIILNGKAFLQGSPSRLFKYNEKLLAFRPYALNLQKEQKHTKNLKNIQASKKKIYTHFYERPLYQKILILSHKLITNPYRYFEESRFTYLQNLKKYFTKK